MPHSCVHCAKIYPDGARELIHGCTCGSKFFFYLTQEKMDKLKQSRPEVVLTEEEKTQLETDVRDIAGIGEEDAPVILDFESVRLLKPGKYLIDIHNLLSKDKPTVYSLDDGKYFVDLKDKDAQKRDLKE